MDFVNGTLKFKQKHFKWTFEQQANETSYKTAKVFMYQRQDVCLRIMKHSSSG